MELAMAIFNIRSAMDSAIAKIKVMTSIATGVIETSGRPTDVFTPDCVQPIFVIHPDHLDGWRGRVADEIWSRLSVFPKPMVLTDTEEAVQRGNYALSPHDLRDFRAGLPVLKIMALNKIRDPLGIGGRKKDELEVSLRAALEFEVYRRDIEIRAIDALQAKRHGRNIDPTKSTALEFLAVRAWIDGVATKGRGAGAGNPKTDDEKFAFFDSLREEGRKIATEREGDATRPREIRDAIISDIFSCDTNDFKPADFNEARTRAAGHVELLMRANAHATAVAKTKHTFSKRLRAFLKKIDGRRKKSFDPFKKEVMTKYEHNLIVANAFTAAELAELAICANIDPNLLCPAHALAWPEFGIARKIGRLGRGEDVHFEANETGLLFRCILVAIERRPPSLYPEVHELLAEYALDAMPIEAWKAHFGEAIDVVIVAPAQPDR
jgi:hypothetical protein